MHLHHPNTLGGARVPLIIVLCCAVLCCVVLCCVVLCRVVSCRVVSRRVVSCCVVLSCVYVVLCIAMCYDWMVNGME